VIPKPGHPHPMTQDVLPVTMGHEFCGRVIQEARNSHAVPRLKLGQAVMVDPRLYCNSCSRCTSTCTNGCTKWGFLGLSGGGGGGLSDTVAVDSTMCYPLPDSVPLSCAPLIEPLTVACHSVKTSGFTDFGGKTVLIIGGGPIGLAVIFVLRNHGARKVFVSEPALKRREQTKEFADAVIDPLKENVGEICRGLTQNEGVDVVFDCAGIQRGLDAGMDALGWRGVYVNVAGWETSVSHRLRFYTFTLYLRCT
jgi:threonine dehydrogenase-like Zn-dependent dehydrogenase